MGSVFAGRRSTFGTRGIVKWIVKWNVCFTMGSVFDGRRSTFGTREIVKWNACYTIRFVFVGRRETFACSTTRRIHRCLLLCVLLGSLRIDCWLRAGFFVK